MNDKRRYWMIFIIIGVAILLIASITTANWYRNRMVMKEQVQTEYVPDPLSVESNKNLDNVSAEDQVNRFIARQNEIMEELIQSLKKLQPSGNGSLDYLTEMISLDKSMVTASEAYLSHGGNDRQFTSVSTKMVYDLGHEITKMTKLANQYRFEEHKNEDKENAYLEDINALLDKYEKAVQTPSSSLEHAFASALVRHHQMAVDMSRSILEYTDYTEIKLMARNMITAREQLIEDLKKPAPRIDNSIPIDS